MKQEEDLKISSPFDCSLHFDLSFMKPKQDQHLSTGKQQKQTKRKKKQKCYRAEDEPISVTQKKNQSYFQKMYNDAEKRIYVNIFIRKLKQLITRSENFSHPLFQQCNINLIDSCRTFLLHQKVQIFFLCLWITVILCMCISSTLILAFPELQSTSFYQIFSILTVIVIGTQIFLNVFSRSSLNKYNQKLNNFLFAKQSVIHYIKSGWFFIDGLLIIVFFCDIFGNVENSRYFKLLVIVKMYPLLDKVRNLEIILIKNCFKQQFWKLIKIVVFNFLFAHFIAIVLLLMADGTQKSWLTAKDLNHSAWNQQYAWSYYWATTIMMTVGFGDIIPTNTYEVTLMIFIQILSCMVLTFNIANTSEIITKITSYEMEKIDNLKIFTQMQEKQHLSEDTRKKITNYIIQSAQLKRKFNVKQQNDFVNKLPKTFNEQLKKQSTLRIFGTIPFFRNLKFSKLQQLAIRINKKLTHPEEIIVEAGTIPEIIIVNCGQISYNMSRVGLKTHGKEIQSFKISQNHHKLVSMHFFLRKPINFSIKCKDYTIVYWINKKELEDLLSTNPYCYQYYCMCRDKDKYKASDWEMNVCDICNNNDRHTYFQCPKLHFFAMRNIVIAKALNNSSKALRMRYSGRRRRVNRQTVSALKYYTEIQIALKDVKENKKSRSFSRKNETNRWLTLQQIKQDRVLEQETFERKKKKQVSFKNLSENYHHQLKTDEMIKPKYYKTEKYENSSANENEKKIERLEPSVMKAECQCCHQPQLGQSSYLQFKTKMRIEYMNEVNKNKNQTKNKRSFEQICQRFTEKLKDELTKNSSIDMHWIIDLDLAHNYGFYFQNQNSSLLNKKWNKRPLIKKIMKKQ